MLKLECDVLSSLEDEDNLFIRNFHLVTCPERKERPHEIEHLTLDDIDDCEKINTKETTNNSEKKFKQLFCVRRSFRAHF